MEIQQNLSGETPDGNTASGVGRFPESLTVGAEELDFSPENSSAVISSTQKFIIPVPAFAGRGEPLVFPAGHEKAGQPITDWQGKPIGESGIVFYNAKDSAIQAAAGNGNAVIIINQVSSSQAASLIDKVKTFSDNPAKLELWQLKDVLEFAIKHLSLVDIYNSNRDFVKSKMTLVEEPVLDASGSVIPEFGFMKRDDRDICQAVFIPGKVLFQGPAADPQKFENGAVIVKVGSNNPAGIQPDIFKETYKHADGKPIVDIEAEIKLYVPL